MEKINLPRIITEISAENGIPQKDVKKIYHLIVAQVGAHLAAGSRVYLKDLGVFSVSEIQEKEVKSGFTGAMVKVRPYKRIFFRVSAELKRIIKGE